MPADHLTAPSLTETAAAVLAVLAGADLPAAASRRLDPAALQNAVRIYQAGGLAALEHHCASGVYQVWVEFPDWSTAETVAATRLGPRLDELQTAGATSGWWFLRKHPHWRLRLHHADTAAVDHALDTLVDTGTLARWWPRPYEPETAAFGGVTGMAAVHTLFIDDSRGVLTHLRHDGPGLSRRELSLLLISGLLRAAGLDVFERGDAFDKIARLRPAPAGTDTARVSQLASQARLLLSIPDLSENALFTPGGPAAHAAGWLTAFQAAGRHLRDAAARGHLHRGLRAILAHIVIFHWNRLGLTATTQAVLAQAATTALLPPD